MFICERAIYELASVNNSREKDQGVLAMIFSSAAVPSDDPSMLCREAKLMPIRLNQTDFLDGMVLQQPVQKALGSCSTALDKYCQVRQGHNM